MFLFDLTLWKKLYTILYNLEIKWGIVQHLHQFLLTFTQKEAIQFIGSMIPPRRIIPLVPLPLYWFPCSPVPYPFSLAHWLLLDSFCYWQGNSQQLLNFSVHIGNVGWNQSTQQKSTQLHAATQPQMYQGSWTCEAVMLTAGPLCQHS